MFYFSSPKKNIPVLLIHVLSKPWKEPKLALDLYPARAIDETILWVVLFDHILVWRQDLQPEVKNLLVESQADQRPQLDVHLSVWQVWSLKFFFVLWKKTRSAYFYPLFIFLNNFRWAWMGSCRLGGLYWPNPSVPQLGPELRGPILETLRYESISK